MPSMPILLVRFLIRKPIVFLSLVAVLAVLGLFTHKVYLDFLFLQNQNIKNLSVVDELVVPLVGLVVFTSILFISVLSAAFLPSINHSGHSHLLSMSKLSSRKLLSFYLTPFVVLGSLPLVYVGFILISLDLATQLDWVRIAASFIGVLVVSVVCSCLGLVLSLKIKHPMAVLLTLLSLVLGYLAFEMSFLYAAEINQWRGLFLPLLSLRNGLIVYADIANYFIWTLYAISLVFIAISCNRHGVKMFLATVVAALLLIVAAYIPGYSDVSQAQKNTLDSELVKLLETNQNVLKVTAVVDEVTNRDEIIAGFSTLKRYFPQTQLEFKSRQSLQSSLGFAGEFIQLSLGDLTQVVAYPFDLPVKQAFEVALLQMLKRKSQWLTFIEGHGEASPLGRESSDLSQLYQSLTAAGWPVAVQNLQLLPELSDNSQLLVIASSKEDWLTKETNLLLNYLEQGGNLLVLSDPKSRLPQKVLDYFGISPLPGVLIDWQGHQSGTPHPAILIVDKMQSHPTVSTLNSVLAFPWSHAWLVDSQAAANQFNVENIVLSPQAVWNELNSEATVLSFDESQGELQQAFSVGVAFEHKQTNQRAIFIGDSHFAANTAINNYANKQFALNLFNWLTHSVIKQSPEASNLDSSIKPHRLVFWLMQWGFSLLFPVILLSIWFSFRFAHRARGKQP
ncbi:DUF4350 domain-containing protein [Aliikangiella sp. IMCC44653]